MSTRVIVHAAVGETASGYTVYVQGWSEPFPVGDLDGLNVMISGLDVPRPEWFGVPGCNDPGCRLAATGAVIAAPPGRGGYYTEQACDAHQNSYRVQFERDLTPAAVIPAAPGLRQLYLADSGPDMAELTRLLAPFTVPADVFSQPKCGRCKAKISPEGPPLVWVAASGRGVCRRSGAHTPGGGNLPATAVTEHFRALWGAVPASMDPLTAVA